MKNILKFAVTFIIVTVFAFSCEDVKKIDQATGKDVHLGELATSDVLLFSNGETDGGGKLFLADSNGYDTCFTKTIIQNNDGSFTTTLTFDSCSIGDGVIRDGQIRITWVPGWKQDTSKHITVEFVNFKRDGNTLNGVHTVKLVKLLPITISIVADNMSLLLSTGETTTWEGTRTVEWLRGFMTPRYKLDDSLRINFTNDGVNRVGDSYTSTGTDLIMNNCEGKLKLTSGTITVINHDRNDATSTLEFNGCNSYTINGIVITQ